jgi:hypothetical protein
MAPPQKDGIPRVKVTTSPQGNGTARLENGKARLRDDIARQADGMPRRREEMPRQFFGVAGRLDGIWGKRKLGDWHTGRAVPLSVTLIDLPVLICP